MASNVIVGQSGGPTAVVNSSLAGVYKAAKQHGAGRVYGMCYGVQGLLQKQVIDLDEAFAHKMQLELLKRTPSTFLGSCRYKLAAPEENSEVFRQIFAVLDELEIGYFIYIGGNDSMDTVAKLTAWGKQQGSNIRFVGVPKTIGNDLMCTDHTPGYGSAAKYISVVMKELVQDSIVYDLEDVTLVEIMGRNAGWLTASAALAKSGDCRGVDLICLPEVAFDPEAFYARIAELHQAQKHVIVAVSEGIHLEDGRYVCELGEELSPPDAFGHRRLTGTARYLAKQIGGRLRCKTRAVELSTLQRCAGHMASGTDVQEAFQAGGAAVDAAYDGQSGQMVALKRLSNHPYQCRTCLVDAADVANREQKLPVEWITPDHTGLSEAFLTYLRPLIQEEFTPIYVDGLPSYLSRKE